MTKDEVLTALDKLEAEMTAAFHGLRGDPSAIGHDREMDIACVRLEESLMWMRRAVARKFA